jgi:uncharacterized SAM-dependent methyltransferase
MSQVVQKEIFQELFQQQELHRSSSDQSRTWDIAKSKFWYATPKQAKGFLALTSSAEYKKTIVDKEIDLLHRLFEKSKEMHLEGCLLDGLNIVDLGCGDGKKLSQIIASLEFFSAQSVSYVPIDVSEHMVTTATEHVSMSTDITVRCLPHNVTDFDQFLNNIDKYRSESFQNHLICLLGNTLGNFNRDQFLQQVSNAISSQDVFCIGNGLINDEKKDWITEYKDESIHQWLITILLQIGFDESDVEYDVRFIDSRIEEIYRLTSDKKISYEGKDVFFQKGDIIITAISNKYSKQDLLSALSTFFSQVEYEINNEGTYLVALCKK